MKNPLQNYLSMSIVLRIIAVGDVAFTATSSNLLGSN